MDKRRDEEYSLAAVFMVFLLIGIGFLFFTANAYRLVPHEKYIRHLVSYADKGEKIIKVAHFGFILDEFRKVKKDILSDYEHIKESAEVMREYQRQRNVKGIGVIKLLFGKKHAFYRKEFAFFLKSYGMFLLHRAELFFFYMIVVATEIEYASIAVILALLLIPPGISLIKALKERYFVEPAIVPLLAAAFSAPDDELGFVAENPFVPERLVMDMDAVRSFVERSLKGGYGIRPSKLFGELDEETVKTLKAAGALFTYMRHAILYDERSGEFRMHKKGLPASLEGHHNPHPDYGLLVHSFAVAYLTVYLSAKRGKVKEYGDVAEAFFAGAAHDAGKIRLYRLTVRKPRVIDSPDALEGDKYIREAKKRVTKKPAWESLMSEMSDQDTQRNIALSKLPIKRFPSDAFESEVKDADHLCVDSELRYTAMDERKRRRFLLKAIRGFFREEGVAFNTFDADMAGIAVEHEGGVSLFLLATFATRLKRYIERKYAGKLNELKFLLPLAQKLAAGDSNRLRPMSYTVSQFLYEAGLLGAVDDEAPDLLGLYDVVVKRRNGSFVEYNAVWIVEDFESFRELFEVDAEVAESGVEPVEVRSRLKHVTYSKENFAEAERTPEAANGDESAPAESEEPSQTETTEEGASEPAESPAASGMEKIYEELAEYDENNGAVEGGKAVGAAVDESETQKEDMPELDSKEIEARVRSALNRLSIETAKYANERLLVEKILPQAFKDGKEVEEIKAALERYKEEKRKKDYRCYVCMEVCVEECTFVPVFDVEVLENGKYKLKMKGFEPICRGCAGLRRQVGISTGRVKRKTVSRLCEIAGVDPGDRAAAAIADRLLRRRLDAARKIIAQNPSFNVGWLLQLPKF